MPDITSSQALGEPPVLSLDDRPAISAHLKETSKVIAHGLAASFVFLTRSRNDLKHMVELQPDYFLDQCKEIENAMPHVKKQLNVLNAGFARVADLFEEQNQRRNDYGG